MLYPREKFLDGNNKPLTQSLFLEFAYNDFALYTIKDIDYEYKGKLLPSMKRLYLEMADPTEYDFASEYLLGWKHWMRICENRVIRPHIDEWRDELEYKIRSQAVKNMIKSARDGNYNANRWLANREWEIRSAGRPPKEEVEREKSIKSRINDEYGADVHRLFANQGK